MKRYYQYFTARAYTRITANSGNIPCPEVSLKVLSNEMDPAEILSFDRYLLKREGQRFFEKSARPL